MHYQDYKSDYITLPIVMCTTVLPLHAFVEDGPLITGRGGGYKIACPKLFALPLPPRDGKTFLGPAFKGLKLFAPPFNMAKTSSSCIKTTSKLLVPPLQQRPPPLFCRGKTSLAPHPVINDGSLNSRMKISVYDSDLLYP